MNKTEDISVFNFMKTYYENGEYEFKIVLHKSFFKDGHNTLIEFIDPSNKKIDVDIKVWGRKIVCTFSVDESTKDGVCLLKINALRNDLKMAEKVLQCWIIK